MSISKLLAYIFGISFILLVFFHSLFLFSHPIGDDMTYAFLGNSKTLGKALIDEYFLWNGRYSSNVFVLLNPIRFSFSPIVFYRIVTLLLSLIGIFSSFYFFKKITQSKFNGFEYISITLLFTLLNLVQMPILSEGMFWYTGVVTYQLANYLTLIYFVFLFTIFQNSSSSVSISKVFFLSVFLLFLIGFNEVTMFILVVFHFLLFFLAALKKSNYKFFLLVLFIVSIIGFLLVYFAPGNAIREVYFIGKSHKVWHSFYSSFLQCLRFGFSWLSNGILVILSILYLPLHRKLVQISPLVKLNFYVNKWVTFFSLPVIIFLCVFPAYWSTGIMGQHRTVNTAYFFFIVLWFINLSVWINSVPKLSITIQRKYVFPLTIFLVVLLVISKNSRDVFQDILLGNASKFSMEMDNRNKLISSFDKNKDTVYLLPELRNKPNSIFVYDIKNDPNYFVNTGYKRYWNMMGFVMSK
jgi:hypothetical protein